jgi:CubicO group peptidase (beta-lactamase class C family)
VRKKIGAVGSAWEALPAGLAARGTKALLAMQGDQVLCEWYAPEWHAARPHYSASLAKALVGGLSLIVALGDGRLSPDDRATRFVPAWRDDPQRPRHAEITIRHLATHSSGIADAEEGGLPHDQLPGWKGQFWRREPDPFTIARDCAPLRFPPGTGYAYSNPGMAMLAYCVTAALHGAPEPDIRTLLAERVYGPIGLASGAWSIGYGTPYHVDELTLWANWGGGAFTARAVASIARLLLQRGEWEGRRLLDARWVDAALAPAGTPLPDRDVGPFTPASGLCWYGNADGVWADVPRDAFAGAGAQHQLLLAVPSLNLIVVRMGGALDQPERERGEPLPFWTTAYQYVFQPVMATLGAG